MGFKLSVFKWNRFFISKNVKVNWELDMLGEKCNDKRILWSVNHHGQ